MRLCALLLLFAVPCRAFDCEGALGRFTVFMDIDEVVVARLAHGTAPSDYAETVIELRPGDYYRVMPGLPEFSVLAHRNRAELAFFSGGTEERNLELVPLLDLHEAHRGALVLSEWDLAEDFGETWARGEDDLTADLQSPYLIFEGRLKKDLQVAPHFDPDRSIFLEDDIRYLAGGQERNGIQIPRDPEAKPFGWWLRIWQEQLAGAQGEPIAFRDQAEVFVQYHRLAFAWGLIQRAVRLSARKAIAVPDALWQLQWKFENGEPDERLTPDDKVEITREGLASFVAVNPAFEVIPSGWEIPPEIATGLQ